MMKVAGFAALVVIVAASAVAGAGAAGEDKSYVHMCHVTSAAPAEFVRVVPGSDFGFYVAPSLVSAPGKCKSLGITDYDEVAAYLIRSKREGDRPLRRVLEAHPAAEFFRIPGTTEYFYLAVADDFVGPDGTERFLFGVEREALSFITPGVPTRRAPLDLSGQADAEFTKAAFIDLTDGDEYYECMEYLTGEKPFTVGGNTYLTRTRSTFSVNHTYAARYIEDYFNAMDYFDEVFWQPFTFSGTSTQNVIAVKRGTDLADEIIVVGGHYDSTSEQAQTLAPGCIDNGSGTDGVMNIARAAALYGLNPRRTIHFIAFGGEEQGLHGSQYYVDTRNSNGYNVISALTMDMIGYSNRYYGVMIEGTNNADIVALMNMMDNNTAAYSPDLTRHLSYFSFGSDHIPFQRAGIPAILAIEQDDTNYPGYHRSTDQINYLDVGQSIGIVRGLAGTMWDLVM